MVINRPIGNNKVTIFFTIKIFYKEVILWNKKDYTDPVPIK
jgi:hypothetical protein